MIPDRNINVIQEEEEDLVVDDTILSNANLCLVGRFVSGYTANFNLMRSRIASTWKPKKGIDIKDIGDGRFLFQFSHAIDLRRVLDGCPWSFGRFPLIVISCLWGKSLTLFPLTSLCSGFRCSIFRLVVSRRR
ncbi:hypothetical protein ACS0TY_010553 [Phlomoides rotata]